MTVEDGGMRDVGCWMLDAGCWMLDAGCWMPDITFAIEVVNHSALRILGCGVTDLTNASLRRVQPSHPDLSTN
jgi:hypothetical protein